jgi:hypothetical protein
MSTLVCIFGKFSLRKRFSQFNLAKDAFMTWHIVFFIKSLRILEEFRKNPCVKIPPKSPCANFQSLDKFKIPFFILKGISLQFRPSQPSRPAGLFGLSAFRPSGLQPNTSSGQQPEPALTPLPPQRATRVMGATPSLASAPRSPNDRPFPLLT